MFAWNLEKLQQESKKIMPFHLRSYDIHKNPTNHLSVGYEWVFLVYSMW